MVFSHIFPYYTIVSPTHMICQFLVASSFLPLPEDTPQALVDCTIGKVKI